MAATTSDPQRLENMKKISVEEARRLVASKEAGWWSPAANPPIPHQKQYVVTLDKDVHYLLPATVFSVKPDCPVMMSIGGRQVPKMTWMVTAAGEIAELVQKAVQTLERLKLDDVSLPTFYGGSLQGP